MLFAGHSVTFCLTFQAVAFVGLCGTHIQWEYMLGENCTIMSCTNDPHPYIKHSYSYVRSQRKWFHFCYLRSFKLYDI